MYVTEYNETAGIHDNENLVQNRLSTRPESLASELR